MTSNQSPRSWILMGLGWLLTGLAALWTSASLTTARQSLGDAAASQRRCAELCNSIVSAGGISSTRNWMMPAEFHPGPQITEARSVAGLTIENLYVSPSGGRSFPGSTFLEQTVEMPDLTDVDLPSVIRFLYALAAGDRVFQINRVTLDAVDRVYPYSDGAKPLQLWNASIDVSYFVENSQQASSRGR